MTGHEHVRNTRIEQAISHELKRVTSAMSYTALELVRDDYSGACSVDRSVLSDDSLRKHYIALSSRIQLAIAPPRFTTTETNERTVLVDMDNVLVDYEDTTRRMIEEEYPHIVLGPASDAPYVEDLTTNIMDRELAMNIQYRKGHFLHLPPVEAAIEGWHRLQDLGYQPRIASSPLTRHFWCIQEKLAWLDQYLGPEVADAARITPDKWEVPGIALIDDMPNVRGSQLATWTHIVFDQPYNQNSPAELRLKGWDDERLAGHLALCAAKLKQS